MHKSKLSLAFVKSKRNIQGAKYILKVIMPLSKDNKLILKSLEKAYESAIGIISFILKYEHLNKNIKLTKDKYENENIFFNKCAQKYINNEKDIKNLKELIAFGRKHKESGFEFLRKDKVVIMSDSLETYELDEENILKYIESLENIINKTMSYI